MPPTCSGADARGVYACAPPRSNPSHLHTLSTIAVHTPDMNWRRAMNRWAIALAALFAFWFLIARGLFWGRRPWHRERLDEWHRRAHEQMGASSTPDRVRS